jgi:predicted permease
MERRTGTTDVPEWKLIWGFVGGILFPASLFMLAYTSNPSFHWIVPCIALALFGTCSHILFMVVSDYVVDSEAVF